jgi:outer membrane protein, multidrug efflux system
VSTRPIWALASLLVLGGCLSIDKPSESLSESQLQPRPDFAAATEANAGQVRDGWLAEFGNSRLVELAQEAELHNPDLAVAAARWEEARARLQVAGSFLQPQLDAFASTLRADPGDAPIAERTDLGLQVGWEVDLWGKLRSAKAAARETAEATARTYEFARQSLAAAVADAWFLAIATSRQLEIDRELLEAEQFTAKVTRDKIEVGATSRLDAEVAEANLTLAENGVLQSEQALSEARKALELLLGRYPATELDVETDLPELPPPPPVGLPSELLQRRPDIVAADHDVAAAFHLTESARAARLPSVQLTASLGTLLDPTAAIWSIGANLLAPIFTGGRLQGQVEIATAQQHQALAQYVDVALTAFREVESALANEELLALRQQQLELADQHLRSAGRIAQDRYEAGIIGILDLTQVRRQDFATRSQLLSVRQERLRQRINLYLALGGSFAEPEVQP